MAGNTNLLEVLPLKIRDKIKLLNSWKSYYKFSSMNLNTVSSSQFKQLHYILWTFPHFILKRSKLKLLSTVMTAFCRALVKAIYVKRGFILKNSNDEVQKFNFMRLLQK